MFIRLVTTRRDPDSPHDQGVFSYAYELWKEGELHDEERRRLGALLVWFERNLIAPDRSRLDSRAIFWFKAGTSDLTRRFWELAKIVAVHGLQVEVLRTSRPGYLVYEDEHQVAAIPFRDTFRSERRQRG